MKKTLLFLLLITLGCNASYGRSLEAKRPVSQALKAGLSVPQGRSLELTSSKRVRGIQPRRAEDAEDQFIFDPVGEERDYIMSSYSYDQTNQKFVHATSLLSRVRYAEDGKTVYFKDLTTSLGVETWLQGTLDGDTIRVAYGQPLAYYKSKYLVFFCPMLYNDSTGVMEAQDELKLIVRGDSLMAPTYEPGTFQCAAGYVFISESTQGALSYDLDHQMARVELNSVALPQDAEPQEYIMTYTNSSDKISKTKVHMAQKGDDVYMQLSTSAPEAYIHGRMQGDSIQVASSQIITDSTFIYYYSLATPVYNDTTGEIVDFVPATKGCYLKLDPETRTITSTRDLFGVDYMDGMEVCMDYTQNLRLDPYAGDCPATPAAPEWRSLNLGADVYLAYVSFNIPNLDVDSNYINPAYISYCLYFDADLYEPDEAYEFNHDNYLNIPASNPITVVPYSFQDGYDFWSYGSLRYVYIYEKLFTTIGVQTVYTVDGVERRSAVAIYNQETGEFGQYDLPDAIQEIPTSLLRPSDNRIYNLQGQPSSGVGHGLFIQDGRKILR